MWKWLSDVFSENAKKLIASAIGAGLAALAIPAWSFIQTKMQAFVTNTVIEESTKEDSPLSDTFKKLVRRERQSEALVASAGNFTLTPTNRSFTLYIYFPQGCKGKFYYAIKGDLVPKKRYVVLAPPSSKPIPLVQAESSIILEKYFQPSTGQSAVFEDVFEQSKSEGGLQKNLHSITFQLEGIDTDEDVPSTLAGSTSRSQLQEAKSSIEISYAALITPALQTGNK
jgi:hypothetical protein